VAVLGVIESRRPAQLQAALRQLAGGIAGSVSELRDRLLDILAHLEANLDFVDEPDVDVLERSALAQDLAARSTELATLADRLRNRDRAGGLPRVVLVGPPNAGKSRLFNALVGREIALVSRSPGTTRDYLSATCDCDGMTIELIDTAGADKAATSIETRAQALRAEQAQTADLVLDCLPADADDERSCADASPPSSAANATETSLRLKVLTKCDLSSAASQRKDDRIPSSALTGAGLEALGRAIASTLRAAADELDLPTTTSARCGESLARASEALASASEVLSHGGGDELVAFDLRAAVDELGKVVGAIVTDDILDRIFSRFCIGK
jgi:tRNA modification GTPase